MRTAKISFCLTLCLVFVCNNLYGQQRSYNDALAIATQKAKAMNVSIDTETIHVARAKGKGKQPENSSNPYYVFNFADNNGFVIVGGDEQLPSIVGYSDKGHFNNDSIPTQMADFLKAYETTIEAVRNGEGKAVKNVNAAMKRTTGSINAVAPLLGGIEWNHDEPFNNRYPFIGDKKRLWGLCLRRFSKNSDIPPERQVGEYYVTFRLCIPQGYHQGIRH